MAANAQAHPHFNQRPVAGSLLAWSEQGMVHSLIFDSTKLVLVFHASVTLRHGLFACCAPLLAIGPS
jgi:hypothetical protein